MILRERHKFLTDNLESDKPIAHVHKINIGPTGNGWVEGRMERIPGIQIQDTDKSRYMLHTLNTPIDPSLLVTQCEQYMKAS